MLRRLVVHALLDYAKAITYIADWLAPPCDNIWRDRAWKQWDAQRLHQREYQRYFIPSNCSETHDVTSTQAE